MKNKNFNFAIGRNYIIQEIHNSLPNEVSLNQETLDKITNSIVEAYTLNISNPNEKIAEFVQKYYSLLNSFKAFEEDALLENAQVQLQALNFEQAQNHLNEAEVNIANYIQQHNVSISKLKSKLHDILIIKAKSFELQFNYASALVQCEEAIKNKPSAESIIYLLELNYYLGRFKEGLEIITKYNDVLNQKTNFQFLVIKSKLLKETTDENKFIAIQILEKIINLTQNYSNLHFDIIATLLGLYDDVGSYNDGLEFIDKILMKNNVIFNDELQFGKILTHKSCLLKRIEKYEDAEIFTEQALSIYENVLGKENPETLKIGVNLANIYLYLKKNDEAEKIYKKAIEVFTKINSKHSSISLIKSNLAKALLNLNKQNEALKFIKQAIVSDLKYFGKKNYKIAIRLLIFGDIFYSIEKLKKAETSYYYSLKIFKDSLKLNHPYISEAERKYNTIAQQRVWLYGGQKE